MAEATKDIREGYELNPLSKLVTQEDCQLYRGFPFIRNWHTDVAAAQKLGFPMVVMAGMQGSGFVSALCTRFFGESWLHGGKLSLNFIGVVMPPGRLTARGVVKERVVEGDRVTLKLEVWLENEAGDKVQAGTAIGTV